MYLLVLCLFGLSKQIVGKYETDRKRKLRQFRFKTKWPLLSQLRMATNKNKQQKLISVGENVEKLGHLCTVGWI